MTDRPPVGLTIEPTDAELRHVRTIRPGEELYERVWASGREDVVLRSYEDPQAVAQARSASLRDRYHPGEERRQRNEVEPLRVAGNPAREDNGTKTVATKRRNTVKLTP